MSKNPTRNPSGPRGKGGRRADLGDTYFRSRWEANWARFLNALVARGEVTEWLYEAQTFEFPVKRGSRFYTPDFLVRYPDGREEFHEIKGYMDAKSATKIKRMRIHYPSVKLVVIDRKEYRRLAKVLAPWVPGWEREYDTKET